MTVRRIGVALGIVALILAFAAGGLYWWADRALTAGHRLALARAPRGWLDSMRTTARVPDLAAFALPRTAAGDGSAAAYDSTLRWTPPPRFLDAYGTLTRGRPAGAADSALWRAVAADATLDRFVAFARRRGWDATSRALGGGGADTADLFGLELPRSSSARVACEGLVMRALVRLARRDAAGARTDLAAAAGVGEQMARREPTLLGALTGKRILAEALRAYGVLASATHDTGLARAARAAEAWAAGRRGTNLTLLEAAPDSALVLAADTTVPLGWRAEALAATLFSDLLRMRGLVFGVPASTIDALRPFVRDRDPDLARLARVAVATAERINRAPKRQRWRSILSNFSTLHP
jgi:hypothetical protein